MRRRQRERKIVHKLIHKYATYKRWHDQIETEAVIDPELETMK